MRATIAALAVMVAGCQTTQPMTASRDEQHRWSRYMATAQFALLASRSCGTDAETLRRAAGYTNGRLVSLGASMGIPPHVSQPIVANGHASMMRNPNLQLTPAQCSEFQPTVRAWADGRDG